MQVQSLDELLKEADALISYYEGLKGVELPRSLHEAFNKEWASAASDAIEEFLTRYPAKERKADKQSVITMKQAQGMVAAFEEQLLQDLVQDPFQITIAGIKRANRQTEFVINHWPELWFAIKELVLNYKFIFKAFLNPFTMIGALIDAISVAGLVVALQLGSAALAGFQTVNFRVGMRPLMKARDAQLRICEKRALPRATSARVRRRKVSRT